MYQHQNNNPKGKHVDDCVICAIATATGDSWDDVYLDLMIYGFYAKDLPNANDIWGQYLVDKGFARKTLPDTCPFCYTVRHFAKDHEQGTFIVSDGTHAIAVVDGNYIDDWDSGDRTVLYFFERRPRHGNN